MRYGNGNRKRGGRPRPLNSSRVLLSLTMLLVLSAACRLSAVVTVDLDLLSYLPSDERNASVSVPTTDPLRIYLLPGIQIDDSSAGPDDAMRTGSLLSFPSLDRLSDGMPTLETVVAIDVLNTSASDAVPGGSIGIFVAAEDSINIYSDGAIIGESTLDPLPAGATARVELVVQVDRNHPEFATLLSGAFRVGVRLELSENTGAIVPAEVSLRTIRATMGLTPLALATGALPR